MQKGVPQIMDITSIRSVLHYLTKNILPTKFETAQQPEPNTIQLCFRGITSQTWLEVSWNGESPRILKINKPEKIGRESTLSKQIRYGLKYMALISIDQDDFERVIKFSFAKKPGDQINKYLIFEIMGKHSNIFYLPCTLYFNFKKYGKSLFYFLINRRQRRSIDVSSELSPFKEKVLFNHFFKLFLI